MPYFLNPPPFSFVCVWSKNLPFSLCLCDGSLDDLTLFQMSFRHVAAVFNILVKLKFNVTIFPSHIPPYYNRHASHDLNSGLDTVFPLLGMSVTCWCVAHGWSLKSVGGWIHRFLRVSPSEQTSANHKTALEINKQLHVFFVIDSCVISSGSWGEGGGASRGPSPMRPLHPLLAIVGLKITQRKKQLFAFVSFICSVLACNFLCRK